MFNVDVEISDNSITDEEAEVMKDNIIFFCNTPKGSLPQMREYGLDYSIIDQPFPILKMKATVDTVNGIREYYGIRIKNINVTADTNGGAKIQITI